MARCINKCFLLSSRPALASRSTIRFLVGVHYFFIISRTKCSVVECFGVSTSAVNPSCFRSKFTSCWNIKNSASTVDEQLSTSSKAIVAEAAHFESLLNLQCIKELHKNIDIYEQLLNKVDNEHDVDSRSAPFAVEQELTAPEVTSLPSSLLLHQRNIYLEAICNPNTGEKVAVRSCSSCSPLLNTTSIQMLCNAAEKLWARQKEEEGKPSSRFTYQRKNNYEAHVQDLFQYNASIKSIMDELLLHKVYPILRHAFSHGSCNATLSADNLHHLNYRLSVYDSLIIRYDATNQSPLGAGQPFHRDLGLCSMNIALNSPNNENNRKVFAGGGTFFENLINLNRANARFVHTSGSLLFQHQKVNDGEDIISASPVIRPVKAGDFVAHPCFERHAGVATTDGVRDILVIFVTAQIDANNNTNKNNRSIKPTAPRIERGARLKGMARFATSLDEKQSCYRAAIVENPNDGEAWQFLGMSLLSDRSTSEEVESAVQFLKHASKLSPKDSRVFNNLGLAYLQQQRLRDGNDEFAKTVLVEDESIEECFLTAVQLNDIAQKSGVQIIDSVSPLLNLGLFYANRDNFATAYNVLSRIVVQEEGVTASGTQQTDNQINRVLYDAKQLINLCERRVENADTTTTSTTITDIAVL